MVFEHLRLSLVRLNYPRLVWNALPLAWGDRDRYLRCKPLEPCTRGIHAYRMPYDASLPLSMSRVITSVQGNVQHVIQRVRLHVTFKPQCNMRSFRHMHAMFILRRVGGHLGGREVFSP